MNRAERVIELAHACGTELTSWQEEVIERLLLNDLHSGTPATFGRPELRRGWPVDYVIIDEVHIWERT